MNNQVFVNIKGQALEKVRKISDLETLRLLTDPLKLKLLQQFGEAPGTARSAAEALGEKVTRLYRHVDALADAGLLEVIAETPKRGTVERTFRAVAERFEVDQEVFSEGSDSEAMALARELVQGAMDEVTRAFERAADSLTPGTEAPEAPLLMRLRIRAPMSRIESLCQGLEEWLAEAQAEVDRSVEEGGEAEEERDYGAMIAFYPIDDRD